MSRRSDTLTPAESSVVALEAAALGIGDFAKMHAATLADVHALESSARSLLFTPAAVDARAEDFAQLAFIIDNTSFSERDSRLLELHAFALQSIPSLAALIRTRTGLAIVQGALASPLGLDADTQAARLRAYVRTIAEQLVFHPKPPAAAVTLAETVPALEARVAAVAQRHRDHAEKMREREEIARLARAAKAREARAVAVLDLRQWFNSKPAAMFMYEETAIPGHQYAARVLEGDNPARVPVWRVRRAIAARKTHEPNYQCPAWQREWAPAEWAAYRSAVEDLRARLGKIPDRVFNWGPIGTESINGPTLAQRALRFEDNNQGVLPASIRKCIAAVQRFDPSYEWRGPIWQGFDVEVDEELEQQFDRDDAIDRDEEYRAGVGQALQAIRDRGDRERAGALE